MPLQTPLTSPSSGAAAAPQQQPHPQQQRDQGQYQGQSQRNDLGQDKNQKLYAPDSLDGLPAYEGFMVPDGLYGEVQSGTSLLDGLLVQLLGETSGDDWSRAMEAALGPADVGQPF
jgi:hypothetical protein